MELGLVGRIYRKTVFIVENKFLLVKKVLAWSDLLHGAGGNELCLTGKGLRPAV